MATEYLDDYHKSYDKIRDKFDELTELENIIMGVVKNPTTGKTTSRVADGRTFTLNLEATERSLSQPPKGMVRALTLDDMGKGMLGQMMLYKHFIPNDNVPYSHLTKLRMAKFSSKIHGVSHIMYDICYRDGYAGVTTNLVPIRGLIPQEGRFSVKDCDYVYVESYISPKTLQEMADRDPEAWDKEVLKGILANVDADKEQEKMSAFELNYNTQGAKGKCHIITRYEVGSQGKWVIIDPSSGKTAKETLNPHESNRIPVSSMHSVPFGDNFFGISNTQRAKPVQQTMDALIKLYLRGVEMSVFPPIIASPQVLKMGLDYSPGALWIEQIQGSIRRFDTNPQGMQTFENAYGFFNGALLNQYGTTDTAVSAESSLDPGYGRTPAAIKKLNERQNTVDSWDNAMTDDCIEDLYDGVLDLMMNKVVVPTTIDLFEKEIDDIVASGYPDVLEALQVSTSGNYGQVTVNPEYTKGSKYRFYIESGTTEKEDKSAQFENINNALQTLTKIPGVIQEIKKTGKIFDIGEAAVGLVQNAGIDNQLKIIRPMTEQETMQFQQEQMMEQMMAQGGMGEQMAAGQQTAADNGRSMQAEGDPMTAELQQMLSMTSGAQGGRPPA